MLGFKVDEPLQAAGCSCAVDPPAALPATEVSYVSLQLRDGTGVSLRARGQTHCCENPRLRGASSLPPHTRSVSLEES